ncbi:MAG TPA: amidohydrolase family protein [Longimicrobiales bacterium]
MSERLLALALLLLASASLHAQTIAITNAKIYPVSGPVIERGTVVISNGRINAVGANVTAPAGARVIDATGKIVTPGFMDSSTGLGIVEIGAASGTNDQSTDDDRVTAAFNVADNLNPFSTLIPITRVEGITRAVVRPQNGRSLIAGQGIVVDLGTDGATMHVERNPAAMFAVLGERGAQLSGGARSAAMLRFKEALQDARDYAANRQAYESAQRRAYALSRLDLEALVPVVRGQESIVIDVNRASDILSAMRLAREYNLKLILAGVAEGWMVAREIAAAHVPVIIDPMRNLPGFESLGITLENAARLNAAGVDVVIASFDSHNSRNIKQQTGNAISYGMPYDAALRAVTINPARLWGIDDHYGTLEPGKAADVVIWSGDPFELTTTAEHVFINGREMSKDTRQEELFQRYRTLRPDMPPAYIK